MSRIAVIGAGPLGRSAVAELAGQGHDVIVATRNEVKLPNACWQRADVESGHGLDKLRAEAIVVCYGPRYSINAWRRAWPTAIANLISTAQSGGSKLVLTGNLYAYAPGRMPMRATDPLQPATPLGEVRAEVSRRLFAAHDHGRIQAVEVRGSDYFGADAPNAYLGKGVLTPVLKGKAANIIGNADAVHTWTAVTDFGRLLARGATDEAMAGRAWHVPSAPAISIRELVSQAMRIAGFDGQPRFRAVPPAMLKAMGWFISPMRAIATMTHQLTQPYVMDDSDTRDLLGETHTDLDATLRAIVDAPWSRQA